MSKKHFIRLAEYIKDVNPVEKLIQTSSVIAGFGYIKGECGLVERFMDEVLAVPASGKAVAEAVIEAHQLASQITAWGHTAGSYRPSAKFGTSMMLTGQANVPARPRVITALHSGGRQMDTSHDEAPSLCERCGKVAYGACAVCKGLFCDGCLVMGDDMDLCQKCYHWSVSDNPEDW